MPRNKYQRRRALRPSTAAPSLIQNELFQHPIQQPVKTSSSSDLGREDARQIRERNNPNTRYIDKPQPTTNQSILRQAQEHQQAASRSVQRQVLGEASTSALKPSGRYVAPSVLPRSTMQLVAKGGVMRLAPVPSIGVSLVAAGAAYAIEQAAQPAINWLAEKLARGLYEGSEAIFGDQDGISFDQMQHIFDQVKRDVNERRSRGQSPTPQYVQNEIERLRKQTSAMNEPHSQSPTGRDSLTIPVQEPVPETQVNRQQRQVLPQSNVQPSQSSKSNEPVVDERNREYQIRRAALGQQPTQEEIGAVLAYGLEQHRINFPHLYEKKTANPLMLDFSR